MITVKFALCLRPVQTESTRIGVNRFTVQCKDITEWFWGFFFEGVGVWFFGVFFFGLWWFGIFSPERWKTK